MLACTLLAVVVPATAVLGAPANAKLVPVECEGASVTVVLVPGTGKPLWDASTEDVSSGPDFLIKSLEQEIIVNGESIGVFTYSFGNRVGQGDPITCAYEEHFVDSETGSLIDVFGTVHVVER